MTADEFHPAPRAIEDLGKEPEQGFVGGGIDGGSGDLDAQFVSQRFADFIDGGAGLQFDCKQNSILLDAQKTGLAHGVIDLIAGLIPAMLSQEWPESMRRATLNYLWKACSILRRSSLP